VRRVAVVAGALANRPWNGGNAWTRLSYVLGLERLGFDVVFVEQIERPSADARSFFELVCAQFGVDGELIVDGHTPERLLDHVRDAAVLVNLGGHLTINRLNSAVRRAIFIDDDPGYTQCWHTAGLLGHRLAGHDTFFTYGVNIGRKECPIPTGGIEWKVLRPPVVLDHWPVTPADSTRLTTVASWRGGYGRLEFNGQLLGQKAHEFRKLAGLPADVPQRLEIALAIDPMDAADRELLERGGWTVVDPRAVSQDPDAFRRYVQGSGGEISAAQGVYVQTKCGWTSDRTASYLASGKPALVQDTGSGPALSAGEGLVRFATTAEAAEGARRIADDYRAHCEAARDLASRLFDSDVVLARMLEEAGLT
jgi:hypothetical protein